MAEPPPDRIRIRGLRGRCVVGVHPAERQRKQTIAIDLTLDADLRPAGRSDDLADTVDYQRLADEVLAMVEASSYRLLERLAERIAEVCLGHEGVRRVRVRLGKPGAIRSARTVCVEIDRPAPRDA